MEPPSTLAELRALIAARLQPVCENWPRERFELLVDSVAAITLKYDTAGAVPMYDRRATERLIEELKDLTRRVEEQHDP